MPPNAFSRVVFPVRSIFLYFGQLQREVWLKGEFFVFRLFFEVSMLVTWAFAVLLYERKRCSEDQTAADSGKRARSQLNEPNVCST